MSPLDRLEAGVVPDRLRVLSGIWDISGRRVRGVLYRPQFDGSIRAMVKAVKN